MGRLRLPRWLRVLGQMLGGVLLVIGLAGLPDDVKTWAGWLAWVGKLDANFWRWVFVIAGVVVFLAVTLLTRSKDAKQSEAEPPSPTFKDVARFDAPEDAELDVYLEREEIHPFEFKANLIEAKIRIENKTNKTKHLAGAMQWQIDPPDSASSGAPPPPQEFIDVQRALHNLQERRNHLPSNIDPYDKVSGWLHVALRHEGWGGVGGFTLTIQDEVGVRYVLRRDRRGGPSA